MIKGWQPKMAAPSREAAWTQIGAISPRDFFPEDRWAKDSRPQQTGEGSLVNGPSPRGQKVTGHKEASSAGAFLQRGQGAGCPWEAGAVGSPPRDGALRSRDSSEAKRGGGGRGGWRPRSSRLPRIHADQHLLIKV
ncbi:unnamed protein product [Rangifer tarandus platyrhynchus]|uniref:Uncharacterized protein n=1 Tax=Rangifer tarandus platyrhynchus TaxID=3082113 RepID=A0ABN8YQV8_RANTA|nr:unnamed protein product [Rangifer tarandus platyrhynchus]